MAYEYLPSIYDEYMSQGQAAWAEYLLGLLRPCSPPPAQLIDMGCGTGGIGVPLARAGYDIIAMDTSPDMLRLAADKARQQGVHNRLRTIQADATSFQVGKKADGLVAACDVVNYLSSAQVYMFFAQAKAALKPGSPLLFDISSRYYYESILGSNCYVDETESSLYIMRTQYADSKCHMDVTFFAEQQNGSYQRYNETHLLRAYDAEDILPLLDMAGFDDIACYGFGTSLPPQPTADRLQFFALA